MAFIENYSGHKQIRQVRFDSLHGSCAISNMMTSTGVKRDPNMGNGHPLANLLANALPFLSSVSLEKFFIEGVIPQTETSFVVREFNQSSLLVSYSIEALA